MRSLVYLDASVVFIPSLWPWVLISSQQSPSAAAELDNMKSRQQHSSSVYNYFCDLISAVLRLALVSIHIPQFPVSVTRYGLIVQSPVLSPVSRSDMSHQVQVRGRGRQTGTTHQSGPRGEREIFGLVHIVHILYLLRWGQGQVHLSRAGLAGLGWSHL